jgi:hypothetical protein
MDKIQDVIPEDKQPELLDSIQKVRQGQLLSVGQEIPEHQGQMRQSRSRRCVDCHRQGAQHSLGKMSAEGDRSAWVHRCREQHDRS